MPRALKLHTLLWVAVWTLSAHLQPARSADSADRDSNVLPTSEDRAIAELLFTNGLVDIGTVGYTAAARSFAEAVKRMPDESTYHYFLGLSQLRLGRLSEAIDSLKRAEALSGRVTRQRVRALLSEALTRAGRYDEVERALAQVDAPKFEESVRLYRGIRAFHRADITTARNYFEQVSNEHHDKVFRESAEDWLSALTELEPGNEIVFEGGAASDDNPGEVNERKTGTAANVRDRRGFAYVRAGTTRFLRESAWTMGGSFDAYVTKFDSFEAADTSGAQFMAQLARGVDPRGFVSTSLGHARVPVGRRLANYLFQVGTSYDWLDGRTLDRRYECAAVGTLWPNRRTSSQASYTWSKLDYVAAEYSGYSGTRRSLDASQSFLFRNASAHVRVGGRRAAYDVDEQALHRVEKEAFLELVLPLVDRFTVVAQAAVMDREFDPESRVFFLYPAGPPGGREDDLDSVEIRLVRAFKEHGDIRLRWAKSKQSSTPDVETLQNRSFEREVVSLETRLQW